jgi:hypothetical protein
MLNQPEVALTLLAIIILVCHSSCRLSGERVFRAVQVTKTNLRNYFSIPGSLTALKHASASQLLLGSHRLIRYFIGRRQHPFEPIDRSLRITAVVTKIARCVIFHGPTNYKMSFIYLLGPAALVSGCRAEVKNIHDAIMVYISAIVKSSGPSD